MWTFAPQFHGVLPSLPALHTKVTWFRSHSLVDGLPVQGSVGNVVIVSLYALRNARGSKIIAILTKDSK